MRRCGYEYLKQLALLESVHVELTGGLLACPPQPAEAGSKPT